MTMSPNPYRGFRFPPEVIEHAGWLHIIASGLSLHDVELILAARGIVVSYRSATSHLFAAHRHGVDGRTA
jgi:putative transposase